MALEVTGKLHKLFEEQQVTERFNKREFVLALEGKYPQYVLFQLTGKRCGDLNAFREGDEVRVEFALRGREWKSRQGEVRFFNSLDVLRLEAAGGARDDDRDYVPSGPPPGFVDDEDVPF